MLLIVVIEWRPNFSHISQELVIRRSQMINFVPCILHQLAVRFKEICGLGQKSKTKLHGGKLPRRAVRCHSTSIGIKCQNYPTLAFARLKRQNPVRRNRRMLVHRPSKNLVLLLGVLLLAAGVRLYAERSYPSASRHTLHFPPSPAEAQELALAACLAMVGSLIGAAVGYRLNRTSAAILGAIGGALATAHYSSLVGALIGGPIGLLVALLTPRRIVVATLSCAVALAIGLAGGAIAGAMSDGPVNRITWLFTALMIVATIAAAVYLAQRRATKGGASWRPMRAVARFVVLAGLALVAGMPLGVTLESARRLQTLVGHTDRVWRPFEGRVFTRGLIGVDFWRPNPRATKEQLIRMTRFEGLEDLRLAAPMLQDGDLALLNAWPRLRGLTINDAPISDRGAAHVAPLNWLWYLELSGTQVTGAGLAQMPMAPWLEHLCLNRTGADDQFLADLPQFTALATLQLNNTGVTDRGLEYLVKCRSLQRIALADTKVSDGGLTFLLAAPKLSGLDLSGTKVTDDGMSALATATALDNLDLSRTKVTDAGLAQLRPLTSLRHLTLLDTHITDAGIEMLSSFPQLYYLDLGGTQVTDASVDALARLPKLGWVNVARTRMTPEGIDRVRRTSENGATVEPNSTASR